MARNIKFQTQCPGCGDTHLAIECKKPTVLTPVIKQVFCDNCESTVLMQVNLPRNSETPGQISFAPMKIKVSEKLKLRFEAEKALEEAAKDASPTEPVVNHGPVDTISLSKRDAEIFVSALESPPSPTKIEDDHSFLP